MDVKRITVKLTDFVTPPKIAERVAQLVREEVAVNTNVALLEPLKISTVGGTTSAGLLDTSATAVVADTEALVVTVHEPEDDFINVVGLHVSEETVAVQGTVRGRLNETEADPKDAVIVAVRNVVRLPAAAEKVADVEPARTMTEGGTVKAATALLARMTLAPPDAAALDSATVQVVAVLDARLVAAHCSEETTIGATSDRVTGWDIPLSVAVMVAV